MEWAKEQGTNASRGVCNRRVRKEEGGHLRKAGVHGRDNEVGSGERARKERANNEEGTIETMTYD